MSEWRDTKLGEVIEVKYGKDHKHLSTGKIPAYGSGGVMRYVDTALYGDESILIPRKGSLNNIIYESKPFWTVDTMFWSKIDKTLAYPKFLFYQLTEIDYMNLNVGSAVPSLTVPVINAIEISLPAIEEQKAIASVLSSLDDKIDLLHRQNNTLERMAETLFRQWFVEEVQEDWEEKPIGDLVKVIDNRGKTPPYTDIPTAYPLIEVNALTGNNRLVDYSVIRKFVDEQTFKTWFRGHPKKYDSLLSTVGSIGEISMFLVEKGSIAQNVIALSAVNICPIYLFEALKNIKDEIKELDIGSVQPSIKVPHLLSLKVKIPSKDKLDNFSMIVKSQLEKMIVNYHQIQTLEKLRDNLLPKLMSGEVRVA